jgi:hypothetical protein
VSFNALSQTQQKKARLYEESGGIPPKEEGGGALNSVQVPCLGARLIEPLRAGLIALFPRKWCIARKFGALHN